MIKVYFQNWQIKYQKGTAFEGEKIKGVNKRYGEEKIRRVNKLSWAR